MNCRQLFTAKLTILRNYTPGANFKSVHKRQKSRSSDIKYIKSRQVQFNSGSHWPWPNAMQVYQETRKKVKQYRIIIPKVVMWYLMSIRIWNYIPGPNFKSVHQKQESRCNGSNISKTTQLMQNSIMHMKLRFDSMPQILLKCAFSKFESNSIKMDKLKHFFTKFN
jgi:hypothetical protein